MREDQWENLKTKHEGKLGDAKHKMEGANEELERLQEDIQERFQEHQKRMKEFKKQRERDNFLKHEKEHLRFED